MKEYRKLESLKFMYEISKDGELRNIKSKKIVCGEIEKGYRRVGLRFGKDNKYYKRHIHRLVMEAWGYPYPDFTDTRQHFPDAKFCIDHIDRNKLNNNICNLRWVTKSESALNRDYTNMIASSRENIKKAQAAHLKKQEHLKCDLSQRMKILPLIMVMRPLSF